MPRPPWLTRTPQGDEPSCWATAQWLTLASASIVFQLRPGGPVAFAASVVLLTVAMTLAISVAMFVLTAVRRLLAGSKGDRYGR